MSRRVEFWKLRAKDQRRDSQARKAVTSPNDSSNSRAEQYQKSQPRPIVSLVILKSQDRARRSQEV